MAECCVADSLDIDGDGDADAGCLFQDIFSIREAGVTPRTTSRPSHATYLSCCAALCCLVVPYGIMLLCLDIQVAV